MAGKRRTSSAGARVQNPQVRILSYADGCWVRPHCLTCDLHACIFDDPGVAVQDRDERVRQRYAEGAGMRELMAEFGLGLDTVVRIVGRTQRNG